MNTETTQIKNEILFVEWQRRWKSEERGRTTYRFIKNVKFARHKWFTPSRSCTYILTGYGPINSSLLKTGATHDDKCVFYNEEETLEHMLFKCPAYSDYRYELLHENRENWEYLIDEKDRFDKFNTFTIDLIKKRNIYMDRLEGPPPRGIRRATAGLETAPTAK